MTSHARSTIVVVIALLALACGGEEAQPRAREEARPAEPEPPRPAPTLPREVLGSYEQIRADLVQGRLERVWDAAGRIETAARREATSAPASLAPHYQALAEACARLREAPRDDAQEARRGFGEVSRHLVALVRAEPGLGEGLSVYECPDALGYRKWVQRGGDMANPYAAADAAPCGSETNWDP